MKGIMLIVMLLTLLIIGFMMQKRLSGPRASAEKSIIDMPNKARQSLEKSMELDQKRIDELQEKMSQ